MTWKWAVALCMGGLVCLGMRYEVPKQKVLSILLEFAGVALIALGGALLFCSLAWRFG